MVKHVILWQLDDSKTEEEKLCIKKNMKENLEALVGVVPGLADLKINISGLDSSNADVMLDSIFESEEALRAYAVHPAHVKAADTYVRPYTKVRMCMDYEI